MATKNAFVTGATGFVGVNLINLLLKKGWQVTAIHRSPIKHPLLVNKPIHWVQASLDEKQALEKALPIEPFTVFHVAADTAQWKPLYNRQYQTNVGGTQNLIEAVTGKQIERFIHTSSISAYGLHDGSITEQTKSNALEINHNYSKTKYMAEVAVRAAVQDGLPAVILNPCHVIGPWDTNNWIQLFHAVKDDNLPGIPPSKGSFAWVEYVAEAHVAATEKGKIGDNYILGGPHVALLELINEMQRQLNKPISKKASSETFLHLVEPLMRIGSFITKKEPQLTPDKVLMLTRDVKADDSKAQKELGYQHKTVPEIVKATLAWLNERQNESKTR